MPLHISERRLLINGDSAPGTADDESATAPGSAHGHGATSICHVVFRTDSLTYTICRALREHDRQVSVWVVDPEFGRRADSSIQRRLAETEGVRIIGRDLTQVPATIDRLVVQTYPRPLDTLVDVPLLASRARAVTLISAGDRRRSLPEALKLQWKEARSLGAAIRRLDRVLYKDGFHRRDLFGLFADRRSVGFDVHSQFLAVDELFAAIHARDWNPEEQRPLLVNFLGSQDPPSRKAILDTVRHLFQAPSGQAQRPRPDKTMFWHEYSDARPDVLPPAEFVRMLTRSDFTLSPRGYSLVTHRPIEAMLRGSIPVLAADELDLYGVQLVDGVNCVAVQAGRWPEAIERIVRMPDAEIAAMRRRIFAMRPTSLGYREIASGICERLGLEVRQAAG